MDAVPFVAEELSEPAADPKLPDAAGPSKSQPLPAAVEVEAIVAMPAGPADDHHDGDDEDDVKTKSFTDTCTLPTIFDCRIFKAEHDAKSTN